MAEWRAVQSVIYSHDWKFQRRTIFGWWTVSSNYYNEKEAQEVLNKYAHGTKMLYPSVQGKKDG